MMLYMLWKMNTTINEVQLMEPMMATSTTTTQSCEVEQARDDLLQSLASSKGDVDSEKVPEDGRSIRKVLFQARP